MIELEDVTTVDELIAFMDEEAEREGRTEYDNATANGAGVAVQWSKRDRTPYMLYFLIRIHNAETVEVQGEGRSVSFEIKALWFDEDGNVTDRPDNLDD